MRKIVKIVFIVFAILIIALVSGFGIIMLDVAGNLATDSHPLPNGEPIGQAIVVYDPGLSGKAKDVATRIGYDLQDKGYNVVLAGVKSTAAQNITDYDLIIVGGPIYMGKAASSVQSYLASLNPPTGATIGAFGYGSITNNANQTDVNAEVAPLPSTSSVTMGPAIKITTNDDIISKCQEFVNRFG
jgi:flavodoxin